MRIQHNIMAMSSYRNYTNNVSAMKKNLEKLSSGYKINRAGDDAAGLAISEKMRAQITGLKQAQNNAKSGINLVQTAEGALQEVQDMLNRMVKLAEQSANGTYNESVDRNQLQKEFQKLTDEINRISDSANFNGIKLLNGDLDASGTSATKAVYEQTVTVTADSSITEETVTGINSVTVTSGKTPADGNVTVKVDDSGSDDKATATGTSGLANLTFTAADNGDELNGVAIEIKVSGNTGDEGAVWDAENNKVVVTLAKDGGTAGTYAASDIKTLINAIDGTGSDGEPDLSSFDVTGSGTVDATGGASDAGSVELDGGDYAVKVTVSVNGVEETKGYESGDWQNDVTVSAGGVDVEIDTTADLSGLATATKVGTVSTAVAKDTTVTVGGVDYTTTGTGDTTAATALQKAVDAFNADTDKSKDWTASVDKTDPTKVIFTAEKAGAVAGDGPAAGPSGATEKTAGTDEATTGAGKALNLQIGDTAHDYNRIDVSIKSIHASKLIDLDTQNKLDASGGAAVEDNNGNSVTEAKTLENISVDTEDNAREALGALKGMVNYISDIRGELGATQNRLDHTINNLSVMEENIQDAESTIRDTDIADEMMAYTKNNILIQSAQAMLAQANQVPQGVLQLLQ